MPRTARILIDQGYYHIETKEIERTEIVPHLMYLELDESVPVCQEAYKKIHLSRKSLRSYCK